MTATSCATCHETGKSWFGVTIVTRPTATQDPNHPTTGECATCHTSTTSFTTGVTGGKPANHIPTTAACTLCHTNTITFKPGVMNHTGITSGCTTCHAASTTGTVFTGVTPKPQGAGHIPTTADCATCHTSTTAFGPGTAMNHAGISQRLRDLPRHGQELHRGDHLRTKPANHIPSTTACETCHAAANFKSFAGTPMNHAPVTATSCATCHETGKSWFGVTIVTRPTATQNPNHPTTGECATCHTSTTSFTTGVTGGKPANHIPTTAACTLCHTNTITFKPGVMNHTGITSGCTTCHAASTTGTVFTGVTPKPHGCGTHPDHGRLRDLPQVDDRIWSEHGDEPHRDRQRLRDLPRHGQGFTGVTNLKTKPANHIPTTTACESCHAPANFTSFAGTPMNHTPVTATSCATCHETGKSLFGVTIVTRPTATQDPNHPTTGECATCHTSTTSFTTGVTGGKPANHIPTTAACTLCHTNTITFKPGVMNHTGITSGCTTCHAASTTGTVFTGVTPKPMGTGHIPTTVGCETCHKSTTVFGPNTAMNHAGISQLAARPVTQRARRSAGRRQ